VSFGEAVHTHGTMEALPGVGRHMGNAGWRSARPSWASLGLKSWFRPNPRIKIEILFIISKPFIILQIQGVTSSFSSVGDPAILFCPI
jgi:hypothetical protein